MFDEFDILTCSEYPETANKNEVLGEIFDSALLLVIILVSKLLTVKPIIRKQS